MTLEEVSEITVRKIKIMKMSNSFVEKVKKRNTEYSSSLSGPKIKRWTSWDNTMEYLEQLWEKKSKQVEQRFYKKKSLFFRYVRFLIYNYNKMLEHDSSFNS